MKIHNKLTIFCDMKIIKWEMAELHMCPYMAAGWSKGKGTGGNIHMSL